MKGKGCEMKTSVKQGSFLAWGGRGGADHRWTGRRKRIKGMLVDERRRPPCRAEQRRPLPRHTRRKKKQGAIFSYGSHISPSLPLPASSSIRSPSIPPANLIFPKALGYLHSPQSQFDHHACLRCRFCASLGGFVQEHLAPGRSLHTELNGHQITTLTHKTQTADLRTGDHFLAPVSCWYKVTVSWLLQTANGHRRCGTILT